MNRLILLFILFITVLSFAQNSSKDEFVINYHIGGHNFGEAGKYELNEVFKFKLKGDNFELIEFLSITNSYAYNPETQKNSKKISDTAKIKSNIKINKLEFENIIKELNTHKDNFKSDFIESNLNKKISKKEILKIASNYNSPYWFVDKETGKIHEFGRKRIKQIQNLNHFEEYIKNIAPKKDEFLVVMDTWNNASLDYIGISYSLDFFSELGQPIYTYKFSGNQKSVINLNVNLILLSILPKKSILRQKISFDSLIDKYIHWYIDAKMWDKKCGK